MDQKQKELEQQLKKLDKPHFWMRRWFILTVSVVVLAGASVGAGFWSHELSNKDTILPRITIANVQVGGLTTDEATTKITEHVENYISSPFTFTGTKAEDEAETKEFEATAEELGLLIDVRASAESAYAFGHSNNGFSNLYYQVRLAIGGRDLPIRTHFDQESLDAYFNVGFLDIETPARDARLAYKDGEFTKLESREGSEVVRESAQKELRSMADYLQHNTIELSLQKAQPDVLIDDLKKSQELAQKMIDSGLNLYYGDKSFTPGPEAIAGWLEFHSVDPINVKGKNVCKCGLPVGATGLDEDDESFSPSMVVTPFDQARRGEETTDPYFVLLPPSNFEGEDLSGPLPVVGLNRDKLNHWLLENISAGIDVPGQNARLAFKDGQVTVTQPSKSGIEVDIQQAAREIIFSIDSDEPFVRLTLREAKPEIDEGRIEELGINALIGRGESDFSGSPANRIHNIKRGFEQYDGLVIGPGDEFSAIEHLGPVDAAAGFLPELVIVGKKITPQYGGGLCQVSTTLFRGAMDAGMEITDRTNHSFSVSYYQWPYADWGVEATIYDPAPDFKFRNDTDAHILIHAFVTEDQHAVVEIYGTDPGRETTIEGPWRLSGNSVSGGTTVFNYIVRDTETGELIREQEFVSVFQPLSQFKHED